MSYKARLDFLGWDRQNAADLFQCRRYSILHEVHKRLDGGQSNVSRMRSIPAPRFQVFQEVHNQRRIELLQMQL